MLKRTITSIVLLLIGFPVLIFGGLPYFLFVGFLVVAAAWEYVDLFLAAEARPSRWLVVGGVLAIITARYNKPPEYAIAIFTFSVLALMAFHLIEYERGRDHAGLDFAVSVGGLAYVGWVGAYLIDLRQLANGGWWVMYVLPCVWLADSGAYLLGAAYGKHRMSPRLSPKKTWEGYAAGAFTSLLTGGFLAYAYSTWGPLNLPIGAGALFGLMVGLLTPLGDLGESMLKRQAGLKDSGKIIPGHGGAFDRIDSWIWAAVMGYYFINWFVR
jgi:phosphatidate cytidylyltransferase